MVYVKGRQVRWNWRGLCVVKEVDNVMLYEVAQQREGK